MTHAQTLSALSLKTFSLSESLRLGLIVGSLSFVILAGQFAQSRGQELTPAAQQTILASATTGMSATAHQVRAQHQATSLERFAISQVRTYGELLDGLTERAELVLSLNMVSPQQQDELKASLRDLDENLMNTRDALKSYQAMRTNLSAKEEAFEDEDLRGSLVNLQQSASEAQGLLIGLDQRQ